MSSLSLLFLSSLLFTSSICGPVIKRATDGVVQGLLGVDSFHNECDGGSNHYTMYTGNGSTSAGWPAQLTWVSYGDLWCINQHIMARSCNEYYNTTNNSDQEMQDLRDAIGVVSHETRVDHRFILAAIMQETKGCVRAASTASKDNIHNPGLLQDFNGTHSCNDNGKIQTPCPKDQILGMIRDGVAGTVSGHGFAEDITAQADVAGIEYAEAYYRAARLYNSGEIDESGDLGKAGATHCYASDIANRLVGWADAESTCTLDKTNS